LRGKGRVEDKKQEENEQVKPSKLEDKKGWGRLVMRETCEFVCEIDLFYDLGTGPSTGW
jgi:hypothetical protein